MEISLVLLRRVHLLWMLNKLSSHLTLLEGHRALRSAHHHGPTRLATSESVVGVVAKLRLGSTGSTVDTILVHMPLTSRIHG